MLQSTTLRVTRRIMGGIALCVVLTQTAVGQPPKFGRPLPSEKDSGSAAGTNPLFAGRYGDTREKLVKLNGGTKESEKAVAKGLAWLAVQQKNDGTWAFDGTSKEVAAATGLGLLPFAAGGFTHKAGKENEYKEVVANGVAALLKLQKADGSFSTSSYAHAIAALALCEVLGMTGDKALVGPCQKAVDLIQEGQGEDGSWGYRYGDDGDTSIVGWQVQVLHAAKMCKELKVDPKVLAKTAKFLDTVSSKPRGGKVACLFGYRKPGPRASLTGVGLLCRYYLNGWGPNNPGLQDGADYLLQSHPPGEKETFSMYHYYYATQVAMARGGDSWEKTWNPRMRDLLVETQVSDPKKPAVDGSWDKDAEYIGRSCGRLGTTALAILTLQVYYRHLPLDQLAK